MATAAAVSQFVALSGLMESEGKPPILIMSSDPIVTDSSNGNKIIKCLSPVESKQRSCNNGSHKRRFQDVDNKELLENQNGLPSESRQLVSEQPECGSSDAQNSTLIKDESKGLVAEPKSSSSRSSLANLMQRLDVEFTPQYNNSDCSLPPSNRNPSATSDTSQTVSTLPPQQPSTRSLDLAHSSDSSSVGRLGNDKSGATQDLPARPEGTNNWTELVTTAKEKCIRRIQLIEKLILSTEEQHEQLEWHKGEIPWVCLSVCCPTHPLPSIYWFVVMLPFVVLLRCGTANQ